jgi:prefoldin subunit 5
MDEETEPTHTVETDGITVTKTVEDDGGVRVDVRSNREATATVRVTDPTLDSHPGEAIQFHSEYDRNWEIDETSTFERTFGPGEQRTMRYRVAGSDPETLDVAPRLAVTEGANLGGVVDRARSDALREFAAGERDSLETEPITGDSTPKPTVEPVGTATAETHPADTSNGGGIAEADEKTATEEPARAIEQASDTDSSTAETAAADEGTTTAESESESSETAPENVARMLLSELQEGHVDDEVRDALRSELGTDKSRSQEIRIDHLQSEVSDLTAYGDAVESFIDRHGTFETAFEDVHSELSTLGDRTERVESAIGDLSETVEQVDDLGEEIEQIQSVQSELESDLEEIRETQTDLKSRFDRLDGEIADAHSRLDEELAGVHDRLDDLELFSERITEALQGLGDDSDG